jgi:hypothetical protein
VLALQVFATQWSSDQFNEWNKSELRIWILEADVGGVTVGASLIREWVLVCHITAAKLSIKLIANRLQCSAPVRSVA